MLNSNQDNLILLKWYTFLNVICRKCIIYFLSDFVKWTTTYKQFTQRTQMGGNTDPWMKPSMDVKWPQQVLFLWLDSPINTHVVIVFDTLVSFWQISGKDNKRRLSAHTDIHTHDYRGPPLAKFEKGICPNQTHGCRNKMDAICQTIVYKAFSCMDVDVFWPKFHKYWPPCVKLNNHQHVFGLLFCYIIWTHYWLLCMYIHVLFSVGELRVWIFSHIDQIVFDSICNECIM